MAKPIINNYQDLLIEKERLKVALKDGKANFNRSVGALKEELNPLSSLKSVIGTFQHKSNSPIVQFGIKRASELLISKLLLKRAGWLPKLIVPFLVQELTSRSLGAMAGHKMSESLKAAAKIIRKTKVPASSKTEDK